MPNGYIARLMTRLRLFSTPSVPYKDLRSSASNVTNNGCFTLHILFYCGALCCTSCVVFSMYLETIRSHRPPELPKPRHPTLPNLHATRNCANPPNNPPTTPQQWPPNSSPLSYACPRQPAPSSRPPPLPLLSHPPPSSPPAAPSPPHPPSTQPTTKSCAAAAPSSARANPHRPRSSTGPR